MDVIYDREGTDNFLLINFGSSLPAKKRKEFNTGVYIALYFLLGGWVLAVCDFYAGYIKIAAVRIILFILGAIFGSTVHIAFGYIFIIISCLIGALELLLVGEKKYTLENGSLVMVRTLDLIYDRKATEAVLIEKYGCGLAKHGLAKQK